MFEPRRYHYAASLSWGGDEPTAEHEVEVEYSVAWGSPESGRFGPPENYDPGSGDMVEDIKLLLVNGKPRPWDMGFGFITDGEFEEMIREKLDCDEHLSAMIQGATEDDQAAEDSYREAEADERRLEARHAQD